MQLQRHIGIKVEKCISLGGDADLTAIEFGNDWLHCFTIPIVHNELHRTTQRVKSSESDPVAIEQGSTDSQPTGVGGFAVSKTQQILTSPLVDLSVLMPTLNIRPEFRAYAALRAIKTAHIGRQTEQGHAFSGVRESLLSDPQSQRIGSTVRMPFARSRKSPTPHLGTTAPLQIFHVAADGVSDA